MRSDLADTFRTALRSAFPAVDMEPRVAATSNPAFGDYQCNNAMQLSVCINGQVGKDTVSQSLLVSGSDLSCAQSSCH